MSHAPAPGPRAGGRGPASGDAAAPTSGLPRSIVQVRVWSDRIEVLEQLTEDRTRAIIDELRRLGVRGRITFNTPCG
jgi:hypothetical protein